MIGRMRNHGQNGQPKLHTHTHTHTLHTHCTTFFPLQQRCTVLDCKRAVLAVGSADGSVSLHEVENGQELHRHAVGVDGNAIVSLEWVSMALHCTVKHSVFNAVQPAALGECVKQTRPYLSGFPPPLLRPPPLARFLPRLLSPVSTHPHAHSFHSSMCRWRWTLLAAKGTIAHHRWTIE